MDVDGEDAGTSCYEIKALHLLHEITVAANQAQTLEEVMEFAIKQICGYTGWPVGHLYLGLQAAKAELVPTGVGHVADSTHLPHFLHLTQVPSTALENGLPGRALATGNPAWSTDVTTDDSCPRAEYLALFGLRGVFVLPIFGGSNIVAILEFFTANMMEPTPLFLQVMANVGTQLGHVVARKQVGATLHALAGGFQVAAQSAMDAIILTNGEGRILFWNRSAQALFGYSKAEILGEPLARIIPPRHLPAHQEGIVHLQAGAPAKLLGKSARLTGLRKDGSEFPLELFLSSWKTGNDTFYSGIIHDRSEQEQAARELAEIRQRLSQSQEMERLALARRLHDVPMQELYAASFALQELKEALPHRDLQELVETVRAHIEAANLALRTHCSELRPPALERFGLSAAITSHAEQFQQQYPDFIFHIELAHVDETLPAWKGLALFRIYQQAMHNVMRHAAAQQVWVRLMREDDLLILEIQDDGQGFVAPDSWLELARANHFGLMDSAERAENIGGRYMVISSPGTGATVRVIVALDS
jgi:PAS domain S-box-containing protein